MTDYVDGKRFADWLGEIGLIRKGWLGGPSRETIAGQVLTQGQVRVVWDTRLAHRVGAGLCRRRARKRFPLRDGLGAR